MHAQVRNRPQFACGEGTWLIQGGALEEVFTEDLLIHFDVYSKE